MEFIKFLKEGTSKKGIDHIEALPADKFIHAVETITEFTATEKLDGANLAFGFENDGRFYTSRETKSGNRMYRVGDYSMRTADNGFKSAHAALISKLPIIRAVMANGMAAEAEILFGRQPNAIVYGANHIAVLRMIPGDNEQAPDQKKVKELGKLLLGETIHVTTPSTTTDDGVKLVEKQTRHKWKFSTVSFVESHHFENVNVTKELKAFKKWLNEDNVGGFTNEQILTVNLTSVKMGELRDSVRAAREAAIETANKKFKLPIKEKFLDGILRVLKPALQDVEIHPHEDVGVEGVVLLNPKTLQQLKLVDKDMFTIINQFNHAIRNEIRATGGGRKKFSASLEREGGDIFGDMLKRIADTIGIPQLGSLMRIKPTLRKYAGDRPEDTLKNVAGAVKTQDLTQLRTELANEIKEGVEDLVTALEKYNKEWKSYSLTLASGKEIKYSDEIHKRTLTVFAEVRKEMQDMLKDVQKSDDIASIVVAIYGKQLGSM